MPPPSQGRPCARSFSLPTAVAASVWQEMPWTLAGGSKCPLFDYACAAKEKAAKEALAD